MRKMEKLDSQLFTEVPPEKLTVTASAVLKSIFVSMGSISTPPDYF